ncbi:hypothetical protein SB690_19995, partial [Bacillus sp. SIMBA_006]|uniref:hypothetical protein n=1 Tax=Bacillus sp. SIMBA_006 TaxID=3085755 RepID=UPI00397A6028
NINLTEGIIKNRFKDKGGLNYFLIIVPDDGQAVDMKFEMKNNFTNKIELSNGIRRTITF